MDDHLRVILVGGTSNIGKSTVALHLAGRLGWECVSTDKLGRYPGRPWARPPDAVKPHVVEHYLTHNDEQLVGGQLEHYRNMWPVVEARAREHAEDPAAARLVLEGSGVWPENVAALRLPNAAAIWLTGSLHLIETRIRRESRYAEADALGKRLIDRFIVRSQGYERVMLEALRRLGLPFVEVTAETSVDLLADQCIERMRILV
ncbi:MAG TPA: hypothetical protein VL418_11030 [Devosiaceae bacterium]|nr:hypothetical protein [Devosiaceae bacterium]